MDQERSNRLRRLERHFPAGATLFEQGDTSREMYILLNGEAEILINEERVAVVAEAGSYLGEMSTLLSEPRTSTIRTTKESKFIVVGPGQVRAFFSYSTPLALKLATILAKRLKETTRDLYQARRALEECQAPSPSGQRSRQRRSTTR